MRAVLVGTLIPVVLVLILGFIAPRDFEREPVVYDFKTQKVVPAAEFARFNPWFVIPASFAISKEEIIKDKIKHGFGVVVDDEGKLSPRRLEIIYSVLENIPREILSMEVLTLRGVELGYTTQDEIPDEDVEVVDAFSSSVVHELNRYVATRGRERKLIKRAGAEKMDYVRSMLERNYFVENPGEFFSSLSRAYFQNSIATLDLSVERFGAGFREPINQVLFFMDVYSRGGAIAPIFRMDRSGHLTSRAVQLVRDEEGRIMGLLIESRQYKFDLDNSGFVANISSY